MGNETDLLANIKGTGEPNPVTVDDINNYNFGLSPDQEQLYNQSQEQFRPVSQPLAVNDYYPNQGDPIGVGQSSGRIIGSQTQYVPNGGLVPIGMWDARDAAIQKAAMAKAKDVADWKDRNMAKAPTSDLTSINEALSKNFFKYQGDVWNAAVKKAGGDQKKAKFILENDANYQAKTKAFYDQAKLGTTAFKHIQDIQDRESKGEIITEPLRKLTQELNYTQDPDTEQFKKSAQIIQSMGPVTDMNDVFNTGINEMKMDQSSGSWIGDDGDYITENERKEQFYSPQAMKRQKEMMYRHYGLGPNGEPQTSYKDPYFNKESIDSFVEGAMSTRIVDTKKNASFKPNEGEGGEKYDYSSTQPLTDTEQNIVMPDGRNESVYGELAYKTLGRDEKQVVRIPISQTMRDSQGRKVGGKALGQQSGYIQGTVSQIQAMPYDVKKSRFLFKSEVDALKNEDNYYGNKNIRLKPRAVVNLDRPDKDKGDVSSQNTVYVDVDEFKGKFANKNKGKDGQDFNDKIEEVKSYSQEFNSKSEQNQAKSTKKTFTEQELRSKAAAAGYTYDEYYKLVKDKVNIK
jgi:hypothetical protein